MRGWASSRGLPRSPSALRAWEQETGPLLDVSQAAALLTDGWPLMRHGVIELQKPSGHPVYPASQFAANGPVLDVLVGAHRLLVDDGALTVVGCVLLRAR